MPDRATAIREGGGSLIMTPNLLFLGEADQ